MNGQRSPFPIERARAALLWERLWPSILNGLAVVALFLTVALADLLPKLPIWLHALALVGFAAALAFVGWRSVRVFRPVGDHEARHRLELDNRLDHRPLTALEDQLAGGAGDPRARALWEAHLRRMAALVRNLKVRWPSPGMARRDPRGLRAAVLLVLAAAIAAGWQDPWARIERAMVPRLAGAGERPVAIEIWITPPAYTRLAPAFLSLVQGQPVAPLRIPAGSAVLAQATGLGAAPTLTIGERATEFAAIQSSSGRKGFRAETTVEDGQRLSVQSRGREIAGWPIIVIQDAAPTVAFTTPPEPTPRNHLRIDYEAGDDYGLAKIHLEIRRSETRRGVADEPLRVELPLAAPGARQLKSRAVRDLTPHPWAGLPVKLRLTALDGAGQTGASDEVELVLPEREFRHPIARILIEERKKLSNPTPTTRAQVSSTIAAVGSRPQAFSNDTVVFLALTVTHSRLLRDESDGALSSVQAILWDTALRLEEGDMSIAERRLMQAQEDLMRAMQDGAPSAEIERLMDELQRALDEFMQALAEQLSREDGFELPFTPPGMETITGNDMRDLLDRARELARMGSMDAARQMLSQLRRMTESLRAGIRPSGPNQQMRQAQQIMNQMRDLIQRQQELLDRTFRRAQERRDQGGQRGQQGQQGQQGQAGQQQGQQGQAGQQQGQQGQAGQQQGRRGQAGQRGQSGQSGQAGRMGQPGEGEEGDPDLAEQEAIRQQLAEMMQRLQEMFGGSPDELGRAEQAMRGAAGALGNDQPDAAVPLQGEALENLRQGMQGAMEQMARSMGNMIGVGIGMPGTQMPPVNPGMRPPTRDPFGRAPEGNFGSSLDGDVKVPEEMEIRRAHEILEELRRRANQRTRPQFEREYIDRLLRQF